MSLASTPLYRASAALVAILLVACSSSADDDLVEPLASRNADVIFLAQNVTQTAVMDALFEGRIVVDTAGCIRLDSPDPATVVWPKGFTISGSGAALRVRDGAGRDIGRIGDAFRLGGGEVPTLHDGISVSAADRQRAETHCPGRYWVVGDVP